MLIISPTNSAAKDVAMRLASRYWACHQRSNGSFHDHHLTVFLWFLEPSVRGPQSKWHYKQLDPGEFQLIRIDFTIALRIYM